MSTVHPSQLPAIVSDLGLKAQAEGYAMEPRVAPLIFETMTISASSPPEGMSEVVISGGKKPGEIARGQAAPARTLDQAYQWFMRIRKFAERIEIPEEMYNSPNGSALVAEMITTATKGWGEGWAQVQEEAAADLFNKGVLAAGHAPTFDGSYSGRPATYSAFIYDGKPFFAATGNGHPLSLASGTTKFNLIVSAALGSTTLDTARVMMESTNAVDEVGDKISIRPNVLVVPPGLTQTAHVLLESQLKPWRVMSVSGDAAHRIASDKGLITGYYEPLLKGARRRGGAFQTPLYAVPDDLLTVDLADAYPQLAGTRVRGRLQGKRVVPYPDRAQLADGRMLAGRELLWVDSAVDAFFLQIQGSGRVQLADGSTVRLAFADVNGRPYRAVGRYLVDKGEMTLEQVTAPALRQWLAAHPERQQEVFNQNPSVVFFRELAVEGSGPPGALGVLLTPERSIAVDPRVTPLGAPVWLSTTQPLTDAPLQRLMLAQDTGGAIRGPVRADFYWGSGAEAGEAAGKMRQRGQMWVLLPKSYTPRD